MNKTASLAGLLHAALQDIHAGLRDQQARMPDGASDPELAEWFAAERRRVTEFADGLEADGLNPAGPANLWMGGVLDDAERDATQTQPGRLLDIALAGAIRKGKVAEAAACDTALALLCETDDPTLAASVEAVRQAADEGEATLLAIIERLAVER